MTNHTPPHIAVSVALMLRSDGSLLLGERPEGKPYAGAWEFPGGKVEREETFEDALRRELHEELGIDAEIGAEVHRELSTYPDGRTFCVAFFRVERWQGEIVNHVFADLTWIAPRLILTLDILSGNRNVCGLISRGEIDLTLPSPVATAVRERPE